MAKPSSSYLGASQQPETVTVDDSFVPTMLKEERVCVLEEWRKHEDGELGIVTMYNGETKFTQRSTFRLQGEFAGVYEPVDAIMTDLNDIYKEIKICRPKSNLPGTLYLSTSDAILADIHHLR